MIRPMILATEKEVLSAARKMNLPTVESPCPMDKTSNRNEMKEYIEKKGGKVTGSVSKNTDYLINNDVTSNSSKNKKARELNIPILSEGDFIKLSKGEL